MTSLPPLKKLPSTMLQNKRVRPKTYTVAVYLVFAVALLELVMLVSIFWLRAMMVSVSTGLPKKAANSSMVTSGGAVPPPQGIKPVDHSGIMRLPGIGTGPGRLSMPGASDILGQIDTLNEEAQVFLRQNDYPSALDMLIRAEDLDPRHPTTLKNLAETYNRTNNPVRSKVYWQRLVDLGPGVGTVYAVAKDHVLLADSGRDSGPLHEASTLDRLIYVDAVEKTPTETRDGNAQFHVRAVIMRKSPQTDNFVQGKFRPFVIFYQQMPDGSLTPDLGQRKGAFEDIFLFAEGKLRESFGIDYVIPVLGAPGANNTIQGKYYGFVIGLYYDKVLQDVRSEPSDLSARMALPREIE